MTEKTLRLAMENATPGDQVHVVLKAAPFSVAMTPQGPMPTVNRLGGLFISVVDGALVFDTPSDDGSKVRQYIDAEDIVLLALPGLVALARPRLM